MANDDRKNLQARIDEIEATFPRQVGSDEGTHGKPTSYSLWIDAAGKRYGVQRMTGAVAGRCTAEEAEAQSAGIVRPWPESAKDAASAVKELDKLRGQLAKLERADREAASDRHLQMYGFRPGR